MRYGCVTDFPFSERRSTFAAVDSLITRVRFVPATTPHVVVRTTSRTRLFPTHCTTARSITRLRYVRYRCGRSLLLLMIYYLRCYLSVTTTLRSPLRIIVVTPLRYVTPHTYGWLHTLPTYYVVVCYTFLRTYRSTTIRGRFPLIYDLRWIHTVITHDLILIWVFHDSIPSPHVRSDSMAYTSRVCSQCRIYGYCATGLYYILHVTYVSALRCWLPRF